MKTYTIKVAVRGVSPMIWRRFSIAADTSLACLHFIIQMAQGWNDEYLHQFHIYGKDYGISYRRRDKFLGPVLGHRVYRCNCERDNTKTVSLLNDWVSEHTHPELKYIETKWASLMSYGLTSDLLKDILPVGERYNA